MLNALHILRQLDLNDFRLFGEKSGANKFFVN